MFAPQKTLIQKILVQGKNWLMICLAPTLFYQDKCFLNKCCLDKCHTPLGSSDFCEQRVWSKFQLARLCRRLFFWKGTLSLSTQTEHTNLLAVVALAPARNQIKFDLRGSIYGTIKCVYWITIKGSIKTLE